MRQFSIRWLRVRATRKLLVVACALLGVLFVPPYTPAEGVGKCRKGACPCTTDQLKQGMVTTEAGCVKGRSCPCASSTWCPSR